jgi:hypothetical protein
MAYNIANRLADRRHQPDTLAVATNRLRGTPMPTFATPPTLTRPQLDLHNETAALVVCGMICTWPSKEALDAAISRVETALRAAETQGRKDALADTGLGG